MMIKKILLITILTLIITYSYSQKQFTISGHVTDEQSGETLVGANIYVKETNKGTTTNTYGFYSLTIPKGDYTIVVSFVGYELFEKPIKLDKNIKLNVSLKPKIITTEEVVVSGEKEDKNVQSTQMSSFEISVEKIKTLPALLGEVDIIKTIQLTPGVQSAGEGNAGIYVRGGGPDQNLILLDEAQLYNVSHLFGFFSIFNSDALKNVELIKGGMPANYGGRLASVINVTQKDGNNRKYEVNGGIGIISSRLTVEGPIVKERSSFIVSGRRTYIDILAEPFIKETAAFKGSGYYFYDINGKLNYILSEKDRIYLSGYYGRDIFYLKSRRNSFNNDIDWGNAMASFRWNHIFSDNIFMNFTTAYTEYDFNMSATQSLYDFKMFSGIKDWNSKIDITILPPSHLVKTGIDFYRHNFSPISATARSGDTEFDLNQAPQLHSIETAIYANDEWNVTDKLAVNIGARYSFFQHIGPFVRFYVNENNMIDSTVHYKKGEPIKSYQNVEPRISTRYSINENSSIKAAYTQNYQYVHLVSFTSVTLPTDAWFPSTSIVKPQFGQQYSLGYFRNFHKNTYESSVEIYYKDLKNQIEFKEGVSPENNLNNNTDNNLTFGVGRSYGIELFLKKRKGKTYGWIGYTLSWTKRKFDEILNGKEFYAKYDRRHDVSIIISHDFNNKLTGSIVWVYATGNNATMPIGRYIISGAVVNVFGERNSYRMSPYHRLDLSLTWQLKKTNRFESNINFSVYNAYNRYNPYYIYFETVGDINQQKLEIKAQQVTLFPILPSISWNFKF